MELDTYTPERSWRDENAHTVAVMLAPPQRKLFAPWPAGAAAAIVKKMVADTRPIQNNRLVIGSANLGLAAGWRVVGG